GHAAAARLIGRGVTAVVCASDLLALGTIRAARRAGLSVPGDVSVVGFDDSALMNCTEPPPTTVRQPIDAIGRAVVDLMVAQIDKAVVPADELLFEPELVVRASTARVRTSCSSYFAIFRRVTAQISRSSNGVGTSHHKAQIMKRSAGLLVASALGLAACGSGQQAPSAGGAEEVTITVACQPAKSAPKERQAWDDDVAAFMKANPGVTVKSTDQQPCFDPKTFGPKLAGGQ